MPRAASLDAWALALCASCAACMSLTGSSIQDLAGSGAGAGGNNSSARLQATLSHRCVGKSKPGATKFCQGMIFEEQDINEGRLRPARCLEDVLPGVRARLCTLCEGLNCEKRKKVMNNIVKTLHHNGERVVSLLRKTHSLQARYLQHFQTWEDAFDSMFTHGLKHRAACIREIGDGTFGPGICAYEIDRVLPGFGELVRDICDHNHNSMVTSGELRSFFSVVHIFSHMAAPVVQSGAPFRSMLRFPATQLEEWLQWEQSEPGRASALDA